jgi:AGZA family xanthine/uracil permease-like MFS transporter
MTRWWSLTRGDVDATIVQVGFNFALMLIPVFLLAPIGIPVDFGISHFIPGYALGFLVGSLGLTILATALARKGKRDDVTAHVYGPNVPAMVAYGLAIMLPVYLQTHDPVQAWAVGAAAVILTGVIKLILAPFCGLIDRLIPTPAAMTVFGAAMYTYIAMALLQRLFDDPLVGIIALALVAATMLPHLSITKYKIPPFLVIWLIPLAIGIGTGYVHPVWTGLSFTAPWIPSWAPLQAIEKVLPYLSVIVPMAFYQVLQDIAAVEGGKSVGDEYDARAIVAVDGIGTLLCGLGGSVVTPLIFALHPPYKENGARIGFAFWTGIIVAALVMGGLTVAISRLFPWPVIAAMVAFVNIGVGVVTMHRVPTKFYGAVLLGFVLPIGAIVTSAVSSALPALHLSAADPVVQAALNKTIFWSSLQGLSNGFLFLILIVAAVVTEMINHNFNRAAVWALIAAAFSWVGLLHAPVIKWGAEPTYALGWVIAAVIFYTARWWHGPYGPDKVEKPEAAKAIVERQTH